MDRAGRIIAATRPTPSTRKIGPNDCPVQDNAFDDTADAGAVQRVTLPRPYAQTPARWRRMATISPVSLSTLGGSISSGKLYNDITLEGQAFCTHGNVRRFGLTFPHWNLSKVGKLVQQRLVLTTINTKRSAIILGAAVSLAARAVWARKSN